MEEARPGSCRWTVPRALAREDLEFGDEYLLDAKKPDAKGAVPLGGAY